MITFIKSGDSRHSASHERQARFVPIKGDAFRHLGLHPLTGDRKGQYAVTLHDRWRLIFTIHGTPPSRVHIEEVTIHYGD